jgi:type VI protein secretion system component Hcp
VAGKKLMYKATSTPDFKKKGQAMKAKKSTKRLSKAKKLEATKPLSKVSVGDISITKSIDKSSPS